MDIVDHLEAINKANDSVQVVIFADLTTQIVLADATKKEIGQEHLDKLCMQAAAAFENPFLSLAERPDEVIVMRDDGVLIALRTTQDSPTAICLLGDYSTDLNSVLLEARNALSETGAS